MIYVEYISIDFHFVAYSQVFLCAIGFFYCAIIYADIQQRADRPYARRKNMFFESIATRERCYARLQNPSTTIKLKSCCSHLLALMSSLTESATSKLGVNDNIFWIYQIGANTTEYSSSEDFFQDNPMLNHVGWMLSACVFMTDLYFIGGLFVYGEGGNVRENHGTLAIKESPVKFVFAYAIVILSCFSEGVSAAPSLANVAYQYVSGCHHLTDHAYCHSSEAYVAEYPWLLSAIVFLCGTRMLVDYCTEGYKCIDTWLKKEVRTGEENDIESNVLGVENDPVYGTW